jgi:2-amino-4-hydroxy-6-hydroxymethyldihydropteridine diphosphokinase
MIIIAIGANLNHPEYGSPRRTCGAALEHLSHSDHVHIRAVSRWYQSAPVVSGEGATDEQPWYVNGAIQVETGLSPQDLLKTTMAVEAVFGRVRSLVNSPRTLDLDMVAYDDQILETSILTLPHPRMAERAFVVLPVADVAPTWKHPVSGVSIEMLRDNLPTEQTIEHMPDGPGLYGTEWTGVSPHD